MKITENLRTSTCGGWPCTALRASGWSCGGWRCTSPVIENQKSQKINKYRRKIIDRLHKHRHETSSHHFISNTITHSTHLPPSSPPTENKLYAIGENPFHLPRISCSECGSNTKAKWKSVSTRSWFQRCLRGLISSIRFAHEIVSCA